MNMDEATVEAIKNAVCETVRKELDSRLAPLLEAVNELRAIKLDVAELKNKTAEFQASIEDTSAKVDDVVSNVVPELSNKINEVATALALQTLDMDVHRRKWNVIIQGLKGHAGESEEITKGKVIRFARDSLKIVNTESLQLAACHRLKRAPDAGIILRFVDLSDRNRWLTNAKYLKDTDDRNVSLGADLPPIIRPLKAELLDFRRKLPAEQKKDSKVRHLPFWPYVELTRPNQDPMRPSTTSTQLLSNIVGQKMNTLKNTQHN